MSFAEWAGNAPLAMTVESAERVAAMLADPESLSTRKGQKPDGVRCMEIRDGIADIAIRGPISRYDSFWSWLLGGTSTEMIGRALAMAMDDPEIKGVVLHVDSGGGQATGIGELAGYIREAARVKPVVSYVEGFGASAAYYLACAASEVILSPAASVGSIGTILQLDGRSRPGELTFVSSQSPKKRLDVNSPEGAAEIQAWLDELSDVFIRDVARYRGVTPKKVVSDFGQGGLVVGKAAVAAGMADRVGNYESAVKRIRDTTKGMGKPRKPAPTGGQTKGSKMSINPFTVLARLWGSNPEAVQEALNAEGGFAALATAPAVSPDKIREDVKAEIKAEFEAREAKAKAEADRLVAEAKVVAASEAKAKAWVAGLLKAEKITPAEASNLEILAATFAADDARNPLQNDGKTVSRFDVFAAPYEKKEPHGLTREVVPGDGNKGLAKGLKVLASADDSEAKEDEIEARVKRALNLTDIGRASLAK